MSFFEKINGWARGSIMLKLLMVGFLMLVLLIPSNMISNLIYERQNLRSEAINEVSSKWGGTQTVSGPVISVPYESFSLLSDGKTKTSKKGWVHFLPDMINVEGAVVPEERSRGIFVVVLYNTILKFTGNFGKLNSQDLSVPESDINWKKAIFTVGISDMKGIESAIDLRYGDQKLQLGPGTVSRQIYDSGASVPIEINADSVGTDFSFELNLNGSSNLFFAPFGKETKVKLKSDWANPSFTGTFLPDSHEVTEEGFTANWSVLELNRNYAQQGVDGYIPDASHFGVRLMLPVDEYQKTNRSSKYATFFIFITFLTFFFIEVLNKKRLHPIQYLLVGAAVILFYVLLLSISEHISFNWSYLIACGIILTLITTYCHFILKNRKLTLMMFSVLAILYGFFYSLLQLQDYALLLGSFGLLLILGTVMYLTRNIDWYGLKGGEE